MIPALTTAENTIIETLQIIQSICHPEQAVNGGTLMVVGTTSDVEWHQPPPDLVIETDTSLIGWGAVCQGVQTEGLWSQEEQLEHINVLELTARMFAVQAFAKDRRNVYVHLRMDNTSALAYVTKMGELNPPD